MCVCVCVSVQEPGSVGELGCRFYGLPRFLSWLCASQPWLLQRLLGFPVLPRHCQLPVFPTEGKKKLNIESQWIGERISGRLIGCTPSTASLCKYL